MFVGRADLALSMGLENSRDDQVTAATQHVLAVAHRAGKIAGMHVAGKAERAQFEPLGANWFIVASDQTLLHQAAQAIAITG